jgi:hypothetical protein
VPSLAVSTPRAKKIIKNHDSVIEIKTESRAKAQKKKGSKLVLYTAMVHAILMFFDTTRKVIYDFSRRARGKDGALMKS